MHKVEQRVLRTAGYEYLAVVIIECVVSAKLSLDRIFQSGRAVNRRVFRLPGANRLDTRFLDVLGRVEIGLAGT